MKTWLLALLLGTACTSNRAPAPDAEDPDAPKVNATLTPPTIAPGGTFAVTVTVVNFTLEPIQGQPNAVGHGHFHVFLDDQPSYLASDSASPKNVTIPADTPAGAHTIKVELVNNDHSEVISKVFTIIDLDVH